MAYVIDGKPFDYETQLLYSPPHKRALKQTTLLVPGGGCKYWLDAKGRVCLFCGLPVFTRRLILGDNSENIFEPWTLSAEHYGAMLKETILQSEPIEKLAIFNGGSFFVNSELPVVFQNRVLDWFATSDETIQLFVESRPQYLTNSDLARVQKLACGKQVMVGIGFESVDVRVRNSVLKKGISLSDFEASIARLKNHGLQSHAYTFLKAPTLNESEAIRDALNTMDYLANLGIDQIALSSAFVPPGTYIEDLFHKGEFRPPWLWSILYIAQEAQKAGYPLSIGGLDDTPPPVAIANNCEICSPAILGLIADYRVSNDLSVLKPNECKCKKQWLAETGLTALD